MEQAPWGWAGTVDSFLGTDEATWVDSLITHHKSRLADLPLGGSQIDVWHEEFKLCQETLGAAVSRDQAVGSCLLLAEYELPGEAGRRPDIVLVTPTGHLMVLEFKSKPAALLSDYDQVVGYVRDLRGYQSQSHDLEPHPMLILTQGQPPVSVPNSHFEVEVDIPDRGVLTGVVRRVLLSMRETVQAIDPLTWLEGDYEPLPSLIQAASDTFLNNDLPTIKTVKHLHELLRWLHDLVLECEREQRHALVLVTGAPGSGKTLIGLQTVAEQNREGRRAFHLSGNGPLVGVLQHCINQLHVERAAKTMVRGMMEFKKLAVGSAKHAPANIYVFDEGQRAWTTVKEYAGTEIQLLLQVAQRRPWGVVVGLIGEGQEIWKNEEGGLEKWVADYQATPGLSDNWTLYAPVEGPAVHKGSVVVVPTLHLDQSVRSKQMVTLHEWVNALLAGEPPAAVAAKAERLYRDGFPIYVTADRTAAEAHVRSLYSEATGKRYGWVASSACKYGKYNPAGLAQISAAKYYMNEMVYGAWYNGPVDHPDTCCSFAKACSEFGCQGLELDFVLMHWGDDLRWVGSAWQVKPGVRLQSGKPVEHTFNAYRVLLTRAREGTVIYCQDPGTRRRMLACGLVELSP